MRRDLEGMISKLKPPGPDHVVVSRRDVARSEIVAAVRLYLDGDIISAHVLASAATELLHGLRRRAYRATSLASLEASLREILPPQEVEETMAFLKLPYNFLKHSGGNLDAQLHLKPMFVEVGVYHAIYDFEAVFQTRTQEMLIFQAWFMARHPGSFGHFPREARQKLEDMDLAGVSRVDALKFGRKMLSQLGRVEEA